MSVQPTVEQRLVTLEHVVTDLQRRLDQLAPPPNWVERLATFKDIPEDDFQEMLRLGREALGRGEDAADDDVPA